MLNLWPATGAALDQLSDDELARIYAYPTSLTSPFVRVNFVSSLDGAATVAGRSEGLSSSPDKRVFHLLRSLCDVVLVGAGTARAEKYGGARRPNPVTGVPPRIAVVTRTAALDPKGRLFTDTTAAPLVLTSGAAPEASRRRLADAGAEVVELDTDRMAAVIDALARRGLHRVLCEGGPHLFADLVAADAVDELCLTVAPLLAGPGPGRIVEGAPHHATSAMRLAGALTADDVLLLRYHRER